MYYAWPLTLLLSGCLVDWLIGRATEFLEYDEQVAQQQQSAEAVSRRREHPPARVKHMARACSVLHRAHGMAWHGRGVSITMNDGSGTVLNHAHDYDYAREP